MKENILRPHQVSVLGMTGPVNIQFESQTYDKRVLGIPGTTERLQWKGPRGELHVGPANKK